MARPAVLALALLCGVAAVSTAAILTRYAQAAGVAPMAIAAWRLTLAALVVAPLAFLTARTELRRLAVVRWKIAFASGVFLALHFGTWISSLAYTSVASSVALVTTNPVWIGLFSVLVLRERMSRVRMLAIALALAGSGLILAADANETGGAAPDPLLGNALALAGSIAVCGYLLIGRRLRASMSLTAYVGVVYPVAALCLMAGALAGGVPLTGYSATAWACIAGLALGPQLIGHTSFNFALKHVSPTTIALVVLAEPVGSSVLAWLLFDEAIGPLKLGGMALLLAGVFLAARSERA